MGARLDPIPVIENAQKPPLRSAGAFWRGALAGIAVAIPLVIATEFLLSRTGFGDPEGSFGRIVRFALFFTALPAALSAGGVARVALHAAARQPKDRTVAAIKAGAAAFAPAGVGLLLLTAIPLGRLPEQPWRWLWLAVAGALAGALAGAVIGRVALFAMNREETDDEEAG